MAKVFCTVLALLVVAAARCAGAASPEPGARPRLVITADPELDDNNTLIRALLYSPDVELEGLVYASSKFHWRGDGKGTTQYLASGDYVRYGLCPCTSWRFAPDEHFIDDIVAAYEKVYPNLRVHDAGYPDPARLKSITKWGNVAFEGDFSQDTDGSNLIKALLLDDRPGPLYVTAQGGESTIARALKSIHEQYSGTPRWPAVRAKVSAKLVIVPSGDQDGTGARYIQPNWPDVRVVEFSGGPEFGYLASRVASAEGLGRLGAAWTRDNVSSRGPLGALYRVWGDGRQMVAGDPSEYYQLTGYTSEQLKDMGYLVWVPPQEAGSFLGEGDTGTFLGFVANGLQAWRQPRWGGWAGTLRLKGEVQFDFGAGSGPKLPADASGIADGLAPAGSGANTPASYPSKADRLKEFEGFVAMINGAMPAMPARQAATSSRFFIAAQDDFAARLKWSVTADYRAANHPPSVSLKGPRVLSARPGATVSLEGRASDPDHDRLVATWWHYVDAGTYTGEIQLPSVTGFKARLRIPGDAKPGQSIHMVLEVTDDGSPRLTRYERVVVTVE